MGTRTAGADQTRSKCDNRHGRNGNALRLNEPLTDHQACLAAAIGRHLASSETPALRYQRLSAWSPASSEGSVAALDRAMLAGQVVVDTSPLQLNASAIEEFFTQRVVIPPRLWEQVASAARLGDLSERLAVAATQHPDVVRSAIAGRLASAVFAIPAIGSIAQNGEVFDVDNEEDLLSLIVDTSAHTHFISLFHAGLDAHRRLYRPTGLLVLDNQSNGRPTTMRHVASTIHYNAESIARVHTSYEQTKTRPATIKELNEIGSFVGVADHARRVECDLWGRFGARTPAVVDEWLKQVRGWTRYTRRYTKREARRHHGNLTLSKYHGEEALVLLWVTCLQSAAWRVEDGHDQNAVNRALRKIRAGDKPEQIAMPKDSDFVARQLFFLIRNLAARDPNSQGYGGSSTAPIDIDNVERAWAKEDDKQDRNTPVWPKLQLEG